MDRRELATFLRSRRERLAPAQAGLPTGPRRRTPGLRREEAARLAHISTEYYTQLEQARAPRPSPEVLSGLARALHLTEAERVHLHHLAGTPPGPPREPVTEVRPGILQLLDRLDHAAAIVTSAAFDVIAWNGLAAALLDDFAAGDPEDRNLLRRYFLAPGPPRGRLFGLVDPEEFAASSVRDLRATAARYPRSRRVAGLIRDLRDGSAEFAALWDCGEVGPTGPALSKTFLHADFGAITVDCDALDIAERDQHVIIYTAAPGSAAEAAFAVLRTRVRAERAPAPPVTA